MRCLSKFSTTSSNERKSGHTMGRNRFNWLKFKKPDHLLLVVMIFLLIKECLKLILKLHVTIVASLQNQFEKYTKKP